MSENAPHRASGTPDRLRKAYVEPTNACNLDCRTCVRHSWDEHEGFMEWPVYERVVEGLAEPATVSFMGLGEPLLHPRLVDMVRLATLRGLKTEVTTNALLLDEVMADALVDAGLCQLVVSIDGATAETFGKVRSGASLTMVVRNVQHLQNKRGFVDAPRVRVGLEFVAMRSNIAELPGLNRVAAQLGASFIIVSNVLAYTRELVAETLYDRSATGCSAPASTSSPHWRLPRFDWDGPVGAAVGQAIERAQGVSIADQDLGAASGHCPFVEADACAVAWHGGVSPCPPLLHTYTCFVQGREKLMTRWEVGNLRTGPMATI